MSSFGFYGYGIASLFFLFLALLLLTSWRGRLQGGLLVFASFVSALWAGILAVQSEFHAVPVYFVWVLETLRILAWLLFLIRLLEMQAAGTPRRKASLRRLRWGLPVLGVLMITPFEDLSGVLYFPIPQDLDLRLIVQVVLAVTGLALVEQVYRNTPFEHRWGIKFLCLGLGGLLAFDFYLFSDALLFRRLDAGIWNARGAVNALVVPLLGIAAARNPQWSLDVFVSRKIVFHTTALLAAGVYLLLMALVGYYIRLYGGQWSSVLQTVFFFGAGVVLVVLLFSGQFRARIKVFVNKHFFSYKYDYREEWLRLISTLSGKHEQLPLYVRIVYTLGELVDSPGGALWLCAEQEGCQWKANWNLAEDFFSESDNLDSLAGYLRRTQWVVNLDEYETDPEIYDGLALPDWLAQSKRIWLIVPLFHETRLLGLVMLDRPRAPQTLNWETTDLLKTAGRQAASYVALEQAATALAEARQFEGFNRLSAFVVHDLKNLIAQLSLVAKNAERHKGNPEFIDDAMMTIRNSVEKMNRLMSQLRSAMPGSRSHKIDLKGMLEEVVRERYSQTPRPRLSGSTPVGLVVYSDRDRLASVIGHVVQNAQDATEATGRVEIYLRAMGDQALIEVVDNGIGMDEAFIRERLYKPFDSTKGLTGMGIGAYECREFVHSLDGRVEVRSTPGEGTRFSIYLPLAHEETSGAAQTT